MPHALTSSVIGVLAIAALAGPPNLSLSAERAGALQQKTRIIYASATDKNGAAITDMRLGLCSIALSVVLAAAPQISDRAARLHQDALVFDAHVHVVDRQFYHGGDMPFFCPSAAASRMYSALPPDSAVSPPTATSIDVVSAGTP